MSASRSIRCRSSNPRAERLRVERWAEGNAVRHFTRQYCELPATAKSTISISFSPDGLTLASTHGDHTVKVISFPEGRVLHTLEGHPRTPWTVKFHPTDSNIVASGCLAFEVRIWDVARERCIFLETLTKHIVSLAFHPLGRILAISSCGNSENQLYLWSYGVSRPTKVLDADHMLRCVEFSPSGRFLITGEANATHAPSAAARRAGRHREITVRLKRWDFDLERAVALRGNLPQRLRSYFAQCQPQRTVDVDALIAKHAAKPTVELIVGIETQYADARRQGHVDPRVPNGANVDFLSVERSATIAKRAVLYNDGGFHISPDERFLTVCLYDDSVFEQAEEAAVRAVEEASAEARWGRHLGLLPAHPGAASAPPPPPCVTRTNTGFNAPLRPRGIQAGLGGGGGGGGGPPMITRRRVARDDRSAAATAAAHGAAAAAAGGGGGGPPALTRRQQMEAARHAAAGEEDGFRLALVSLAGSQCGVLRDSTRVSRGEAKEITSVKFSPSCAFILVGYQRRGNAAAAAAGRHLVATIYRTEDMCRVNEIQSHDDDVNIALFHPFVGEGFVYGTKQGQVCIVRPSSSRLTDTVAADTAT